MSENISKLFNLMVALIFFSISVSIMINVESNLKGVIKNKNNKNYLPSELSLKYIGASNDELKSDTKNRMLIANLLLEKSRLESEDVLVKCFGESVNLTNKTNGNIDVVASSNDDIKTNNLMSILIDSKNISVNFIYDKLELKKIEIVE